MSKIEEFIEEFIDKTEAELQNLEHKVEPFIPQALHIGVVFGELLDNPIAEALLTAAVGATTEEVIDTVVKAAIKDLKTAENIINLPTYQEQLLALAQIIATETAASRDAFIVKLSQLVLAYLHGKKLPQNKYDYAIQRAYTASMVAA